MRVNVLADAHWESRVDQLLKELSATGFRQHFETRDYGEGLTGVTVVLMAQDPSLGLRRRVRHSKREGKLYLDIMLDLPTMRAAEPLERKRIVAERLAEEVPAELGRYKFKDFDEARFVADFRDWIASTGW